MESFSKNKLSDIADIIEIISVNRSLEYEKNRLDNNLPLNTKKEVDLTKNSLSYEYYDEMSNYHNLILLKYSDESFFWINLISKHKNIETINIFKDIINNFQILH